MNIFQGTIEAVAKLFGFHSKPKPATWDRIYAIAHGGTPESVLRIYLSDEEYEYWSNNKHEFEDVPEGLPIQA